MLHRQWHVNTTDSTYAAARSDAEGQRLGLLVRSLQALGLEAFSKLRPPGGLAANEIPGHFQSARAQANARANSCATPRLAQPEGGIAIRLLRASQIPTMLCKQASRRVSRRGITAAIH